MAQHIEGLSQEKAYTALSVAGNHELKTLCLGFMRSDTDYTPKLMNEAILDLQGGSSSWELSRGYLFNFALRFPDAGFATQGQRGYRNTRSIRLNTAGTILGKAFAGHWMGLSLESSPSLLDINGPSSTRSSGIQSSHFRIPIMRHLVETEGRPCTAGSICKEFDFAPAQVENALAALSLADLLVYETNARDELITLYSADSEFGAVQPVPQSAPVLLVVTRALQQYFAGNEDARLNMSQIIEVVAAAQNPQDPPLDREKIRKCVVHLVRGKEGALIAHRPYDKGARTRVTASDGQLQFMGKVLAIFDGVSKPTSEYLDAGQQKVAEVVAGGRTAISLVGRLMAKGLENALGRKDLPEQVAKFRAALLEALGNKESPASAEDLQLALKNRGLQLSRPIIYQHMAALQEEAGNIGTVQKSGVLRYFRMESETGTE